MRPGTVRWLGKQLTGRRQCSARVANDKPGRQDDRLGTGLLAGGPTAWTGWAEWSAAGWGDKRVGLVHAVTNALAIGTCSASWIARQRGRRGAGVRLALAGAAISGVGAYLGGHLAAARKVGSRYPG
ncbi:MAG TPA: hypothetical protein VIJ15_03875 [Dermatophilaceae bacterium]